jgi:hypothetical protein
MSAKTIFAGGNSQFLPALAGLPNTTPQPITTSAITTAGLSFENTPANGSFSSIQFAKLANLNPGIFTAIDAGAGVGGTATGFLEYVNYRYSNLATLPPSAIANVRCIGSVYSTTDGVLTLNTINIDVPSNGLVGYCNLGMIFTNSSNIDVLPTEIDLIVFVSA